MALARTKDLITCTYQAESEPGNNDKCPSYLAFSPKVGAQLQVRWKKGGFYEAE